MTMVHKLRCQAYHLARVAGRMAAAALVMIGVAAGQSAADPPVHYNHAGVMPPGAIGREQLLRGGPLPGYFQPVEVTGPPGIKVSAAVDGQFEPAANAPLKVGMLIGAVYRLRVTHLPYAEGMEVFPTIEVINRLYPPLGQEHRFPIPVELTREELEMAVAGKFVTRVVYLEDPENALPAVEDPQRPSYFEVTRGENPLDVADRLGRPMAILRMGGRVPGPEGPDNAFLYGSPPLLKFRTAARGKTSHSLVPPAGAGAWGKAKRAPENDPLGVPFGPAPGTPPVLKAPLVPPAGGAAMLISDRPIREQVRR